MIGERLAEIRKDNGDTQKSLSEKMNVSFHTVSSWEQEKSEPTCETLIKICKMYNVSADYLLGLSDDDPMLFKKKKQSFSKESRELLKSFEAFLVFREKNSASGK